MAALRAASIREPLKGTASERSLRSSRRSRIQQTTFAFVKKSPWRGVDFAMHPAAVIFVSTATYMYLNEESPGALGETPPRRIRLGLMLFGDIALLELDLWVRHLHRNNTFQDST